MRVSKTFISAGVFAAVFLFAFLSCSKQQPQYQEPTLKLEPERADFGKISINDPIAFHDVSLTAKNLGKEQLKILKVELPEGFEYEWVPKRDVIEGGDEALLKVTLDSRQFSGPVSETGYILSNAPENSRAPFQLIANITEQAAPTDDTVKGPRIQFDHKAYDFGPIPRTKMVEHRFPFKNIGQKPLKILGIETLCMCTTAYTTKTEIAPGESAAIVARVEPYKYDGVSPWKALTIRTNDPQEDIVNVSVAANIIDAAVLEPDSILLPNVPKDAGAKAQVKLLQQGARKLEIKKIETSSPYVQVASSVLQGDEEGFLLDISLSPSLPLGEFNEVATIFTNYQNYSGMKGQGNDEVTRNYSRLVLPIKGSVSGAISLSPQRINFGSCEPGQIVKRKLVLSSSSTDFEIKKASLGNSQFRVLSSFVQPGRRCEIIIEFRPEPPAREISDELVISTTDSEFKVPVFATVKSIS